MHPRLMEALAGEFVNDRRHDGLTRAALFAAPGWGGEAGQSPFARTGLHRLRRRLRLGASLRGLVARAFDEGHAV